MGHFPSGVTVVTTALDEELAGITVNSFTSLSLDPTLVLVCIDRYANSHDMIAAAGIYAINMLREDQAHLSQRFAMHNADKFTPASYLLSDHGLPILDNVLATLECKVVSALPGGDHTIYIGEVFHATCTTGKPLLYFRSGYHQLGPTANKQ